MSNKFSLGFKTIFNNYEIVIINNNIIYKVLNFKIKKDVFYYYNPITKLYYMVQNDKENREYIEIKYELYNFIKYLDNKIYIHIKSEKYNIYKNKNDNNYYYYDKTQTQIDSSYNEFINSLLNIYNYNDNYKLNVNYYALGDIHGDPLYFLKFISNIFHKYYHPNNIIQLHYYYKDINSFFRCYMTNNNIYVQTNSYINICDESIIRKLYVEIICYKNKNDEPINLDDLDNLKYYFKYSLPYNDFVKCITNKLIENNTKIVLLGDIFDNKSMKYNFKSYIYDTMNTNYNYNKTTKKYKYIEYLDNIIKCNNIDDIESNEHTKRFFEVYKDNLNFSKFYNKLIDEYNQIEESFNDRDYRAIVDKDSLIDDPTKKISNKLYKLQMILLYLIYNFIDNNENCIECIIGNHELNIIESNINKCIFKFDYKPSSVVNVINIDKLEDIINMFKNKVNVDNKFKCLDSFNDLNNYNKELKYKIYYELLYFIYHYSKLYIINNNYIFCHNVNDKLISIINKGEDYFQNQINNYYNNLYELYDSSSKITKNDLIFRRTQQTEKETIYNLHNIYQFTSNTFNNITNYIDNLLEKREKRGKNHFVNVKYQEHIKIYKNKKKINKFEKIEIKYYDNDQDIKDIDTFGQKAKPSEAMKVCDEHLDTIINIIRDKYFIIGHTQLFTSDIIQNNSKLLVNIDSNDFVENINNIDSKYNTKIISLDCHMSSFDLLKSNSQYFQIDQQFYKFDNNNIFDFKKCYTKKKFKEIYINHYINHFNYQTYNLLYSYLDNNDINKSTIYF